MSPFLILPSVSTSHPDLCNDWSCVLGRLNLNRLILTPDILVLQQISRQWVTECYEVPVWGLEGKSSMRPGCGEVCVSHKCGQPYHSKTIHEIPWRRRLKIHWIYQHNSNVSGIIFICLLVWGLFRSYLCAFISATIKPKNHVEIFTVPMNPGAGGSQNVHGTYGKTHELRTRMLVWERLLCRAKQI